MSRLVCFTFMHDFFIIVTLEALWTCGYVIYTQNKRRILNLAEGVGENAIAN